MRMYDIIAKKRDGGTLTQEEIAFAVNGFAAGSIPDYQMSALMMAVYLRGMTATGDRPAYGSHGLQRAIWWTFRAIGGVKADKHSTGGVGDKTTLVAGPIVAACGVKVAKMSGRGLGHTGGTLDKIEAIPGCSVSLTHEAVFPAGERHRHRGHRADGQPGSCGQKDVCAARCDGYGVLYSAHRHQHHEQKAGFRRRTASCWT